MNAANRTALFMTACLSLGACATTPTTVSSPPAPPVATPAPAQDAVVYAYPLKNQTPDQQDRDRYECHLWAVKQSGFDPSAPGLPQRTRVRIVRAPEPPSAIPGAAVTGAVLGALIGGPYHAAGAAAAGAIAGAAVGTVSDSQRAQRTQEVEQARTDAQRSRNSAVERKASEYRRAISACFTGRGYSTQ